VLDLYFYPKRKKVVMKEFSDATESQVNEVLMRSSKAFSIYRKSGLHVRANFMRLIAGCIGNIEGVLLETAIRETNLGRDRLLGEIKRTLFQLTSYAEACEKGEWLKARIDHADHSRVPPKPDIRKTMIPVGPVVVFGASNFPFAYSTAGGDTACALAAGCTVVVKAHPAHPETSELVAGAIRDAARKCDLPDGIFEHVHGAGNKVGESLVCHPLTKSVGFTGSYSGGMALFTLASQRKEPIPVFAEMGSVNPVYLMPGKLASSAEEVAGMYAGSITLSCGQFCTNPGILVGITGEGLSKFKEVLAAAITEINPQPMLHPGISKAFKEKRDQVLSGNQVSLLAEAFKPAGQYEGIPTVTTVSASNFIDNPLLHQEIFGPYSLLVECNDHGQMLEVARVMEGQLTSTIIATEDELKNNGELVDELQQKCGRIIFNGVPTGVEVCLSMQHGGPFPASTDSRFTAVGADGISRFARPICFQNWSNELLPPELQNDNPLQILRTINNKTGLE
jgi:NADP-dependent aldehyde dehydrogenase